MKKGLIHQVVYYSTVLTVMVTYRKKCRATVLWRFASADLPSAEAKRSARQATCRYVRLRGLFQRTTLSQFAVHARAGTHLVWPFPLFSLPEHTAATRDTSRVTRLANVPANTLQPGCEQDACPWLSQSVLSYSLPLSPRQPWGWGLDVHRVQ